MDTERNLAKSLFLEAVELAAEDRAALLDSRCAGDPNLREEVEALLRAHRGSPEFLAEKSEATGTGHESPGVMIGRYKLLQEIGEGGFGSVWMAEQQEPVRRKVALKIIKLGMDTKQVVARFEAERQALARMDHPNIAKVFDGGSTEGGRPFFVMELVRGVPITEYCDEAKLSTRERLDLFTKVCHAVQHAHQKGIIHRDIKPTNVMVTLHDGVPVPKVIDFGIAKATSGSLTDKTLFTEFRQFVGTPQYMSPEQAEISGLDVDTRADIYSLGVLLYELLTGTTPFDAKTLRDAAYDEILRVIREVEPPRPSNRVSTLGKRELQVARNRSAEPGALQRLMRGDLDWIVMKALEKERTRRYDTARGMALDVGRYLEHEPVTARPPSTAYRLRKFAQRNRAGVLAGALVALALVAGTGAATVGFVRASDERDKAVTAEHHARTEARRAREAEELAREEARRARQAEDRAREQQGLATASGKKAREQAAAAEAINAFYDDMLVSIDPQQLRHRSGFAPGNQVVRKTAAGFARDVSVAEMLREAAGEVDAKFAGKPELQAKVRETIGVTLLGLGRPEEATIQLEQALELNRGSGEKRNPDALRAQLLLGTAYSALGRTPEAEELIRPAVEGMKQAFGAEDARALHASSLLGETVTLQGRYDEAEAILLETLEAQRRVLGSEHRDTLDTLCELANVYLWQTDALSSAEYAREVYEVSQRTLSPDDIVRVEAEVCFGASCEFQLDFERAEPLLRSAIAKLRRLVGEHHASTYIAQAHLARCLEGKENRGEREKLMREALTGLGELVSDCPSLFVVRRDLAYLLFERGAFEEAIELARTNLEIRRRVDGEGHPRTLEALVFLKDGLTRAGRTGEAEEAHREVVRLRGETAGEYSVATCSALNDLARFLLACGKVKEAEAAVRRQIELWQHRCALPGAGAEAHYDFGRLYLRPVVPTMRDPEAAIPVLVHALELSEGEHLGALEDLALAYRLTGSEEDAELMTELLIETSREKAARRYADHATLLRHARLLLTCEIPELRDAEAAQKFARRAEEKKSYDPDSLEVLYYACLLSGRPDEARAAAARQIEILGEYAGAPDSGALELNNYLWAMARPELEELHERQPLEAAIEELSPFTDQYWDYLNTLGVAQYRAGQFEQACETLTLSDRRNREAGITANPAFDLIVLGMSHHRLGQKERARELIEKSDAALLDPELTGWEELQLQCLLEEAKRLIGAVAD